MDQEVRRIFVYILTADPRGADAERVASLFNDPLFKIRRIEIDPSDGVTDDRDNKELARIMGCLKDSQERYPNDYIIIVKDNSVSVASPGRLATIMKKMVAIQHKEPWDIFYLCSWQDDCSKLTNYIDIGGLGIAKTQGAQGIQALAISPDARNMLLGNRPLRNGQKLNYQGSVSHTITNAVKSGGLMAVVSSPNLIHYDISQAQRPEDYLKTQQCADGSVNYQATTAPTGTPPVNQTSVSSTTWMWLLAVIVIVIIIIIVFWIIRSRKTKVVRAQPQPM